MNNLRFQISHCTYVYCICDSPTECDWTKSIKQLYNKTREYLSILNEAPPAINVCVTRGDQTQYKSGKSVEKHGNNVLNIMRYKSQHHNNIYQQLKYFIANKWKPELLNKWNIGTSLSPRITLQIQNASEVTDKSFNTIATMTNTALGWRLYSSHNSKFEFRKQIKHESGQVMDLDLTRNSSNYYDQRSHKTYTIYYMNDCEIMVKCLDKWVNGNKWVFMPHFGNEIWWTQGYDKATNGGLIMIVGLVWATLSVKDCMLSLYIPGDVKEDSSNILKCHHSMNYPKQLQWQALGKRPACISLVFYNVGIDGYLTSRLVQSCIVMINPKVQSKIDELKSENEIIINNQISQMLLPHQLNQQQFDLSWSLRKTKKRKEMNNWKTALSEIKQWEQSYQRPPDLKCMAEQERQGYFNPNSM